MTLTETVFWTKILTRYLFIGVFLLIGGYFIWVFVIFKPEDKILLPNYACGRISPPEIVAQDGVDVENASIQVKALSSALPDSGVPPISYVFTIDIRGETFETRDRAKQIADNLDFEPEAYTHEAGSTKYVWNNVIKKSTLIFDTATDNFSYFKDESQLPVVPNLLLPATTFRTPDYAESYLSAIGVYNSEFQNGETFIEPVALRGGKAYTVPSTGDAQLLRIDLQKVTPVLFYPSAILSPLFEGDRDLDYTIYVEILKEKGGGKPDDYITYYARRVAQTPETSNVQLYISEQGSSPSNGIYKLDFNNWKVEEKPCGTYPLRKPSEVIAQVAEGAGTVVSLLPTGGDKLNPVATEPVTEIVLYDMELAYYEANKVSKLLQPIYVLIGEAIFDSGVKGKIAIYVPAIKYETLEQ